MDSDGVEFRVVGYFDGNRNREFNERIAPTLKPGHVLAIRYAEKKIFLDMTGGIRLEV